MVKICEFCGKEFETERDVARFCNHKCYWGWLNGRTYNREIRTCPVCKKKFEVQRYRDVKYCSINCYHELLRVKRGRLLSTKKACFSNKKKERKIIKCLNCEKEMEVMFDSKRKFCSKSCVNKYRVGEKSSGWKGGISSRYDRLKRSNEWKAWRTSVFERDNYTCMDCGIRSGCGKKIFLHPHHLVSVFKDESMVFDINNGITLCASCHGRRHAMTFGKKK